MKELAMDLEEFEALGKEVLKHKYLYYVKSEPTITDYEYDMLELKYTNIAKTLPKEPEVHLIADWSELEWYTNGAVVDFPADHPWAEQIIEENR